MANGGREQNIERKDGFFRGEDKDFDIRVKQSDDLTAQNMTGWALEWVLLDREGGRVLVTKNTSGGTIAIGNGDGTNDKATFTTLAADTASLPAPDNYWHELWRVDSGARRCLVYGTAHLRRGRY